MKSILLSVAVLLGSVGPAVAGFAWNGFTSGMSIEAARARLSELGMTVTSEDPIEDGTSLVAIDKSAPTRRLTVLNFCGNHLNQAQFDLEPSFAQFVQVVATNEAALGEISSTHAETETTSSGDRHSLSIWWRQEYGLFSIRYHHFVTNDQLSLVFEDIDVCKLTAQH